MAVIFVGMIAAFVVILNYLPEQVDFKEALEVAGATRRMEILDFSFDWNSRYTFWSGLIGGTFLALSYFGTDQSQVQRYLSGSSVRQSQMGLIFNGLLKVPMQFFILLVGIMLFVFYQFHSSPLNFNPAATDAVMQSEYAGDYENLQNKLESNRKQRAETSLKLAEALESDKQSVPAIKERLAGFDSKQKEIRKSGVELIEKADDEVESNDRDYVFIHFILNNLPTGLVGLLLAVILSAAMSSTASELNYLASTTTLDLYKRNVKSEKSDAHFVKVSKLFTLLCGVLGVTVASTAKLFENLIQLVNIIGSVFYGNVLGIFLLAFFVKFVRSHSVFIAGIITQIIVIIGYFSDWMPYLWLNLFGCALVMTIAVLLEAGLRNRTLKI
jgi:Na+/proline symporter